ncbi:hypothetical protein [Dyadobacter sp. CY351]|nr:hypothetical protein [Dyadobacter sp. CY351]
MNVGNNSFTPVCGTVSTGSVEIIITVNDKRLERVTEQPLGANVLRLEYE